MNILKTPPPQTELLSNALPQVDYADAFTCSFEASEDLKVDHLVIGFFNAAPKWVETLLKIRNRIVRVVGLKVSDIKDKEVQLGAFKVEKGNQLGLFKVFDREENEVLMGEDDKHLNFRVSFLLEKIAQDDQDKQFIPEYQAISKEVVANSVAVPGNPIQGYSLTLTTFVTFNNFLGRLYFLPVKPMHKIVVSAMMRGIIKELKKKRSLVFIGS